MPLFDGVIVPNANTDMPADEKIAALQNAIYELNEKLKYFMNNLEGDNFTNAYAEENKSVSLLTQKVAALEESIDQERDYIVWSGYVSRTNPITGAADTWFVRKWKGGRIWADIRIKAVNQDPLSYTPYNDVYYTICLAYGVVFPYTLETGFQFYAMPRQLRMGMSLQQMTYTTSGITGAYLWSPVTAPFNVTGTQYLDVYVRIEGMPI